MPLELFGFVHCQYIKLCSYLSKVDVISLLFVSVS